MTDYEGKKIIYTVLPFTGCVYRKKTKKQRWETPCNNELNMRNQNSDQESERIL